MTRNVSLTVFFFVLLSALASSVHGSVRHLERDELTGHVGSTREEILARRERRKKEFTQKLEELREQLKAGFDSERLRKKIKAYEHKLEYLNKEVDDRVSILKRICVLNLNGKDPDFLRKLLQHIQRLLDREEILNDVHRERILKRSMSDEL